MKSRSPEQKVKSDYYDSAFKGGVFSSIKRRNFIQNWLLLKALVHKDLVSRYQRSILGVWWSLINPTLTALVLFIVFNSTYGAKLNKEVAFGPYVLSGTLMVAFLGTGIVTVTQNLQSSSSIFTRLPAPPEFFAFSSALVLSLNLLFGLMPLVLWNLIAGGKISPWIIFFPLLILFGIFFITGIALICFILVVKIGDFLNLIVLGTTLLMYISPVFYSYASVSWRAKLILNLNPITHFLNIFRGTVISFGHVTLIDWAICAFNSAFFFILGLFLFKKQWPRTASLL